MENWLRVHAVTLKLVLSAGEREAGWVGALGCQTPRTRGKP